MFYSVCITDQNEVQYIHYMYIKRTQDPITVVVNLPPVVSGNKGYTQCAGTIFTVFTMYRTPQHETGILNDPIASVINSTLQHAAEVMHNPTKSTQLMNFKWGGLNHRAAFK